MITAQGIDRVLGAVGDSVVLQRKDEGFLNQSQLWVISKQPPDQVWMKFSHVGTGGRLLTSTANGLTIKGIYKHLHKL